VKRSLGVVLIALAATLPSPAHAADASFDSAAVIAKARALNEAVRLGDAASLWAQFDDRMRKAMGGDVSKFEATLEQITAQTGRLEECITEDVGLRGEFWIYRGICRYSKAPQPLVTQYAFSAFGKVAGFFVKPDVKLHDTQFLEYQTKAALQLPFFGPWRVFWGGRTLEQNYHAATRDQRFAYDLVAVRDSMDHSGSGRLNADYYAFGMPIVAPASGKVTEATDGIADNAPGQLNPKQPAGNHVMLDLGGGEYALLAHLKKGTVRVKKGLTVAAGDTLGLCGNSGNTSQPHLHFHLQNGPTLFAADGLPAAFTDYVANGKPVDRGEPVRGEIIERKRELVERKP